MILVCGEALIDLFVGPAEGAEMPARAVAGGSPFNIAVGLARLGVDVSRAIVSARCWRASSFVRASMIASGSYRSAVDDFYGCDRRPWPTELCFSR
jgi:sugar/nucleoside kinase (ribokinase family)